MCERLLLERPVAGTGIFLKGNEPEPILMPIIAAQCQCGAWHARTPSGKIWVDAVPA